MSTKSNKREKIKIGGKITGLDLGFSERVSQFLASGILRLATDSKGNPWIAQPELFQNTSPLCILYESSKEVHLILEYPLWKQREKKFTVLVRLESNGQVWCQGFVFAFHHDLEETHYSAAFIVTFSESGPSVKATHLKPIRPGANSEEKRIVFGS